MSTKISDIALVECLRSLFAELMKAAGVDTIRELRTRKPENLQAKMAETNQQEKLTRVVPSVKMVTKFVEGAKALGLAVTH